MNWPLNRAEKAPRPHNTPETAAKPAKAAKKQQKRARRLANRDTWVELLLEAVCAWLFAASVCLLVDAQFPTVAGTVTILWHTAAIMGLLYLLTRRWWILPALLGLGAVVAFFWLLPWDDLVAQLALVEDFFRWWFSNLPLDSPWYTPQTMAVMHWLIHLAISVGVFALLRLLRRSWPLVLLGVGVQAFIFLAANMENTTLSLALYLIAVFPLLVRDRFSGRRMFTHRSRNQTMDTPRWAATLVSALLCVAVAMGMIFLLPADTSELRLRFCSDMVADLQTTSEWYTEEQRENSVITLADLGLQPNRFRLGGDLVPLEENILAVTSLKEETLLKMTTFDTFTGKKWENTFEKGYRYGGYWSGEQAAYLNSAFARDLEYRAVLDRLMTRRTVKVTLTAPSFFLPIRGQLVGLREDTYSKNALSFNARGDLLTYTYPQPEGYTYTFETMDPDLSNYLSAEQYAVAVYMQMAARDPLIADDAFYFHYTAIPENISEDVLNRTYDLTDGVATKLEGVLMLSRYFSLSKGYTYTDTPGPTGGKDNVVDQVLRTKQGYCVHYATAMAMMTRAMGVPSRLAAGYRTVTRDGVQVIDGAKPYVWVECYFDNLGWLSFDPTPGEDYNRPLEEEPPVQLPPLSDPPEEDDPEQEKDIEEDEEKDLPPYLGWLLPLSAVMLVLLVLTVRGIVAPWFYRLKAVRRRYPSTRRQAIHYYRDILRQLAILGYRLQPGETLCELVTRFGEGRPPEIVTDTVGRLQPVLALQYGGGTAPTEEEVAALATLRTTLEGLVRRKLVWPVYILRRRVLLPRFSPVTHRYK